VAGPLGRILQHDQVGDILVLLGGQVVAQELLELGVQVADGEVGRQAVGQDQRAFDFNPVELGRTDVVDEAGDAAHGRNLGGDLLVLVLVVEDGRGEVQATVERRTLQADLIGVDQFRLIAVDRVRRQDRVAAHIEAARLIALGVGGVAGDAVREVVGQRRLGRELIEAVRARVVGAQQDRGARRAAQQRAAGRAQIVGAEHVAGLVVDRIAGAQAQVQTIGQVQVDVGEQRDAGRLHVAGRADDDAEVLGDGVEGARGGAVQVEDARHALPAVGAEQRLEFLGELVVGVDGRHVQRRRRRVVEVDQGVGVARAIGGDRLDRPDVVEVDLSRQRDAFSGDLVAVAQAGVGVIDAARNAGAGADAGLLAVAVTRVRAVLDAIIGQAEEGVVGGLELDADAAGQDILVVVLGARVQVLAVAVAVVAGDGAADAQLVGHRHRALGQQIDLVVAAVSAAQRQLRRVRVQTRRDVFDGAADRVAAVQRPLRPAQDLDALDIEDVQHGALRAGHIDVVDIEADAGLEAPQRVLLADAADEGDQGRVGPARHLDGRVGRPPCGAVALTPKARLASDHDEERPAAAPDSPLARRPGAARSAQEIQGVRRWRDPRRHHERGRGPVFQARLLWRHHPRGGARGGRGYGPGPLLFRGQEGAVRLRLQPPRRGVEQRARRRHGSLRRGDGPGHDAGRPARSLPAPAFPMVAEGRAGVEALRRPGGPDERPACLRRRDHGPLFRPGHPTPA
uniref:NAD-specific glutamate dehydrogenase n=1 Tax=Parastrongyloides trichosuri TaxID=131310 RepID=A0A0N5A6Y3_PARTI